MCCSFNMRAADEIYTKSPYRDMLQTMQSNDKMGAFLPSNVPLNYMENGEPRTIPGREKGLVLLLDAHSDTLAPASVEGDFRGFTAVVESSGSFPLLSQAGLPIRPGYNNIITLTSSTVNADDSMRELDKENRNCIFSDENTNLKIHKEYSYLNCKFECSLFYAQQEVNKKHNVTCLPWFFPSSNESLSICDPWQSFDFFEIMSNQIPDKLCSQCMPDCSATVNEPTIITLPFDHCDASNLGVSRFCTYSQKNPLPMQEKLGSQIQNEFFDPQRRGSNNNAPDYISSLQSSMRNYEYDVFKKTSDSYDAFDRDIAMVQVIYQKSTIVLMGSKLTMTWIDYFATVGGLLGLVLGMGLITFIELLWLCLRIVAHKCHFTNCIA